MPSLRRRAFCPAQLRKKCCSLAAAALVLSVTAPALAQAPRALSKVTFPVARAASEIRIDGVLDEDAWKSAAVLPLPYEWSPGDNVPPPVETECLVTYDAKYLYVAFRAHDPIAGRHPRAPDGPRRHRHPHPGRPRRGDDRHLQRRAPRVPVSRQSPRRAGRRRLQRTGRRRGLLLGHDLERCRPHHRRRLHRRGGVSSEAAPLPAGRRVRRPGASRRFAHGRATCATGSRRSRATATRAACSARRTRSRASRASPRGATSNWTRRPRSAARTSSSRRRRHARERRSRAPNSG